MTAGQHSGLSPVGEWPPALKAYVVTLMALALLVVAFGGAMGLYFVRSDDFELLERARLAHVHFNGHVYLFAIVGLPFALSGIRARWALTACPLLAVAIVSHALGLLVVEENATSPWVIGSAGLLALLVALMAVRVLVALWQRKSVS